MKSYVRIYGLLWADILVAYALFVMQDYLTDVWGLSLTHAAGILNIWSGIAMMLPVFFLFLVDSFLGNFMMLVISSIAYSVGIGFVTMSTPPVLADSTGTCKQYEAECIGHTQKVLFYIGMALIAVGVAGHMVSVKPFLEKQPDNPDPNSTELLKLPATILLVIIPIVGAFALPYIKPWSLRFGIPAIATLVTTLFFLTGCVPDWKYEWDPPKGSSPLTNVCRVFVAFAFKISEKRPEDDSQLHTKNGEKFKYSRGLRCLEKAAIVPRQTPQKNRWTLCAVADVEEAKIAVRMVPMWLTFIVVGIVSSIGNTYFIEQAKNMDRNLGKWRVPLPVLKIVFDQTKEHLSDYIAQAWFLEPKNPVSPEVQKKAKVPGKYQPSKGIAAAMISSVACCIAAALVERGRVKVIIRHGLLDQPDEDIPMSIFWLLFQFVLLGAVDGFFEKSVEVFYKYQAPKSMRSYLEYFTKAVSGLGFMCSVLTVYVVGKISERGGRTNWFQFTLNRSRLDRYYWVLAALSSVNFIFFTVLAFCFYKYKDPEPDDEEADDNGEFAPPSGNNGAADDEEPSCSCCC